ncbi:MAG TPA: DUF6510 family protein [Longimicrobiales bacterium]|nr:DUF6510 family protein [Longimicrobiales bacterium]
MNGNDRRASEPQSIDEDSGEALRLDGNAAAGILSEVFVPDITTACATCANCGAIWEMGALPVYAHGMGTVMRCPTCDAVILRVARTRTRLWLDARGARLVVMVGATALPAA